MTRLARIKLLNMLLFQAGWFTCVIGAARGYPWLGALGVVPIVLMHLHWANRPKIEARLLAVSAVTGLLFDALLLASGWVSFPNGWWLPGLAPYWMACMWLLFATTLNLSMSWLHYRPGLAALFGAVGGPLAYFAGERLGGIALTHPAPALIALATGWAIITPLLVRTASKLNGFAGPDLPDYVFTDIATREASRNA